jgi:tetratricopeptide (TPR) repeat protein
VGVNKIQKAAIGAAISFVFLHSLAFADEITDRARRLINQNDPKGAYALLAPLESQRAGDPDFDSLLGLAALNSGEREKAIFALERVLAVRPNDAQARAGIARAYLELGEKENARREFETVRASNPPDSVKRDIDRYLSALGVSPTLLTGFLEAGYGYDSNVNSATANSTVALPALGGLVVAVAPGGVKEGDHFTLLNGGLNLTHGFAPNWAIVAGAAGAFKWNQNLSEFDTTTTDANLGLRWAQEKDAVTVGYQYQDFRVDHQDFRQANGGILQWQHNFSEYSQIAPFIQVAKLTYPDQDVRDATRSVAGLSFGYGWDTPRKPLIFGTAYGGQEKEKNTDFPQIGNKLYGLRLGGQFEVLPRTVLFGLVSYEHRHYNGDEPFFLETRVDKQYDSRIGVNYSLGSGWLLVAQVAHTNNQSNIDLDAYNRTVSSISVRWTF